MKKIAILGASYLQKPLVEKANSMDIETHCFAWDTTDAVCKELCFTFHPISVLEKESILEKCRELKVDGIITIATDVCMPTISFVAEELGLIANSYISSLMATNKEKMRKAFLNSGVNIPKHVTVSGFDESVFKKFEFPLIVKPTDRSGSRGVTKVNSLNELECAILMAVKESFENRAIVEEFINGNEVSVESISWKGNHDIITITDKVTTNAPYFVELEHHQPSLLDFEIQNKIKKETIKALQALQIEYGASHAEFKITEKGEVYCIEVGARMGGDFIGSHLVELSTGYDYLKAVIQIALGLFNMPKKSINKSAGVYFLCKETDRLLPFFNTKKDEIIQKGITNTTLKNIRNSNDRSGYLIYKSNNKIIL